METNQQKPLSTCCHELSTRFGKAANGKQRYRCPVCKSAFIGPETRRPGNHRIDIEKEKEAIKMMHKGVTLRSISTMLRINKSTLWKLAKLRGIKMNAHPYKWSRVVAKKRDRGEYCKKYQAKHNHHQRLLLNEKMRGCIALWLAKNSEPQSVDKIHAAMNIQFPDLKKSSMVYMLHCNCEGVFKKVGQRFTYQLPEIYIPQVPPRIYRTCYFPEREAARAIYCDRNNIKDEVVEWAIKRMLELQKEFVHKTQLNCIEKAQPMMQLLATASAITKET